MIARGATLGEVAEFTDRDVPEEELRELPDSDHIDEVVYGLRRTRDEVMRRYFADTWFFIALVDRV